LFGEIALLFEIKTKRLTEAAKVGDEEKLVDDLRKGILDAKSQLVRSRAKILSGNFDNVTCEGDSEGLFDDLRNVKHSICVSVMAHEIPAYPLLVRTLMKQEDVVDVLAVSLFDIRMITTYLNNIFDLIYYFSMRSKLGEALIYETEAALLAYHLKVRLTLPDNVDAALIDAGYAQELDADYPSRSRGEIGLSMQFGIKAVDSLVSQLIALGDPRLFRTFSMIRGMSGEAASDLNRLLIKAKSKLLADRSAHDGTLVFGRSALTFVLAPSQDAAMKRIALLRAKRDAENRFDEEHLLILSVRSSKGRDRRSGSSGAKTPLFQLRGIAHRKGRNANPDVTVFPVRIPSESWSGS
jgi:hypothetical protein